MIERIIDFQNQFYATYFSNSNQTVSLSKVIKFTKGKKPKSTNSALIGKLYLSLDSISSSKGEYTEDENCIEIEKNDIIMVMDGASSGTSYIGYEGYLGSTLSKIEVDPNYSKHEVYLFLKRNEDSIKGNNTGSAIPHANKDFILSLEIPIISKEFLVELNTLFSTLFKLREVNYKLSEAKEILLRKYF